MKLLKLLCFILLFGSCNTTQEKKKESTHELKTPETEKHIVAVLDGPTEATGLSVQIIADVDLSKELPNPDGRHLRMRHFVLAPGGKVPVHSHVDRPAIMYVIKGEAVEHRSDKDKPTVIKAGEVIEETTGYSHWVENVSDEPLEFISADNFNTNNSEKFTYKQIRDNYGLDY
ncbi:MAG: cupin domain-containing protein [Flavobacteriaceae bacterium]|nr:cupin domain-containing protein [Flavobacteriaceae bacterium]